MRRVLLLGALLVGCSDGQGPPASDGGGSAADLASPPDLASTGDLAGGASHRYDSDGADTVTSYDTLYRGPLARDTAVKVYVPGSAGTHPVVIVSAGLAQKAKNYSAYGQRMASWGMVVVLRADPSNTSGFPPDIPASDKVSEDVVDMITTWLPAQQMLMGKLDLTRVGLAGHSRGGMVSLLAAENGAKGKVKAAFLLDPVDATGGGMGQLARTKLPMIGIPTGFLGEITNATAGSGLFAMACAPMADNFQVLYAAAPAPSFAFTALGANHMDFQDRNDCTMTLLGDTCTLCDPQGTATPTAVLAMSVRYATAFFARELLGDGSMNATLDGAGTPAEVATGVIKIMSK